MAAICRRFCPQLAHISFDHRWISKDLPFNKRQQFWRKMVFCIQPIDPIKAQSIYEDETLFSSTGEWRRTFTLSYKLRKPWIQPSVVLIFRLQNGFDHFYAKNKLDVLCIDEALSSWVASLCGSEEKPNSLLRRVMSNKSAEVRGDQSTAPTQ